MAAERSDPHDRTAQDLATAVRDRRRRLGLRQEDLADLAGVSTRFVETLEAGKPTIRLDKAVAVLDVLALRLAVVSDQERRR